jgi:CRP-like cAMP-binding protein
MTQPYYPPKTSTLAGPSSLLGPSALPGNLLLASLPADMLAALMPKMTEVVLASRQSLYGADAIIDSVYFPDSGMVSLIANLDNGMQAEVGIVGREGVVGTSLIAGVDTSYVEAMVQMPGAARRLSAADFRLEFNTNTVFRGLLLRYNEALATQAMQTAACNGRHDLEQRLARWLLTTHDRSDRDDLPLTQEFMAMMLGVHRPSITIAAGILQRAGLIRYGGGRISILDRSGLEQTSCECYAAVRKRFKTLLGTNFRDDVR